MKLKKIAALALAGVMAVSMLAGCKGNAATDDSASSTPTVSATGVSAKIQEMLTEKKIIKLSDSDVYNAILASSIKDAKLEAATMVSGGLAAVKGKLQTALTNAVADYTSSSVGDYTTSVTMDPSTYYQKDGVYAFAAAYDGELSEEVLLNTIATQLNANLFTNSILLESVNNSGNVYTCEYTGSISIQKVTDGSASQWYVLVIMNVGSTKTTPASK